MLLRRMRDAKPDLTAFMLKHWKASLAAMECGQSEDPDAATPEGTPEPVVEATPEVAQEEAGDERDDRDGNAVGDEGIGAVEEAEGAPEDQLEQMPLESCEMSQLDEETLEAVQPEEGRGPQTRESVTASPEPEAAPGNKLMTEAQLPREMRHFLALLKVHRFEQKSHILAIPFRTWSRPSWTSKTIRSCQDWACEHSCPAPLWSRRCVCPLLAGVLTS